MPRPERQATFDHDGTGPRKRPSRQARDDTTELGPREGPQLRGAQRYRPEISGRTESCALHQNPDQNTKTGENAESMTNAQHSVQFVPQKEASGCRE